MDAISVIRGLPREARDGELVALDVEMFKQDENRLHRPHGTFACISAAFRGGEVYQLEEVSRLPDLFERIRKGRWVFHNAAYDIRQLRRFITIEQRQVWDTMLVDLGLFGGWFENFKLGDLYRRWTGKILDKKLRSEFGTQSHMTDAMSQYAALDALVTLDIADAQAAYAVEQKLSLQHYWLIDEPCIWAIIDMPPARINTDGWLELAKFHEQEGIRIQDGLGFNVYSHTQTQAALKKLGLVVKNTNKKDTLMPLERTLISTGKTKEAQFVRKILDARIYRKAASTYGKEWVDENVEPGGFVYGDYWTIGTRSSRMACSKPNLQNIPTRELPIFRKLFIPTFEGGAMSVADCWQQEVCVLAWMSKDKNLLQALKDKRDLHQETADDFGINRREGKDINLGLGYGMSAKGLALRLGISITEAEYGIRRRNQRYPEVRDWGENQRESAFKKDYVETSLGRRLWINRYDRQWERHSINLPIQGTAAEHTKMWFIMCHQFCRDEGIPFRIPLVVHDELLADVEQSEIPAWGGLLGTSGVEAGNKVVQGFDMTIQVSTGDSWGAKQI